MASLKVKDFRCEAVPPILELNAGAAKNRRAAEIPLREDLVEDLKNWLADRTAVNQPEDADDAPLLSVPQQLVKSLDRDLAVAGIAKRDTRGRTLDVHSLRHSFATLLSVGGTAPRVAQAALRHSDIGLTMNTYTDPKLLDVSSALLRLPNTHPNLK